MKRIALITLCVLLAIGMFVFTANASVKAVDDDVGLFQQADDDLSCVIIIHVPVVYALSQDYPNPFNKIMDRNRLVHDLYINHRSPVYTDKEYALIAFTKPAAENHLSIVDKNTDGKFIPGKSPLRA